MEYLNIKLETVGDIRYVGSRPLIRATWLNLLIYCVKQENSGRIVNCASWGDDTWAQIAGVKKKEVHAESRLWEWDGTDLVVWAYPLHNEHVCRVRREVGRSGGKASGESRRSSKAEAKGEANAEPIGSANGEATLEQKGKVKVKEEIERENSAGARPGEMELQADAIAASYCRQDSPLEVRQCILDDLNAGTAVETLREGVLRCMQFIRAAPGGSANQFVPKALTFFRDRQWRSPEAFQERWNKKPVNGHESKPKVQLTTQPKGGW